MSYAALRARVEAAEAAVDSSLVQTRSNWYRVVAVTRHAMTPLRLIGSGLVGGLLVGIAEPLNKIGGGARLFQMLSSVASFVAAIEAKSAAEEATDSADTATEVAAAADPSAAIEAAAQTAAQTTADTMADTAAVTAATTAAQTAAEVRKVERRETV